MTANLKVTSLAASNLDLNQSTLRKYASLLEGYNYPIARNAQGQRMYSEDNLNKIKELRELLDKGFSLAKAAEMVTVEYQGETLEDLIDKIIARLNIIEEKLGM